MTAIILLKENYFESYWNERRGKVSFTGRSGIESRQRWTKKGNDSGTKWWKYLQKYTEYINKYEMSFLENLFNSKKNRYRRRPFATEDKSKEERPATTCEMPEDRYCRICFDDKKKEVPITPCRCKGTIGLVHLTCLEKWLSMSNTHSCELCGYNFKTLRTPKYRVLYSIYYWVFLDRNPQYHRGLRSDFIVFVMLTPIAFVGVYSCIVAADFYSKEPTKYSPASRWTTISLLIMVVLLTFAYYLWVAVTIRFHMRIWYVWWQANNIVKVMPRDPSSSSFEMVALSVHSSTSRHSNRRALNETSSSHAESQSHSTTDTQPPGQNVTV